MIFHKSGPLVGQARGYAFVTYNDVSNLNLLISIREFELIENHYIS